MDITAFLYTLSVWAVPVLLAVTFHEVAHGWMANRHGDDTAAKLGRLSWNPLRHIDPVGTVIVPLVLVLTSPFVFGWAKPVPVVPNRLNKPRRDMALVALAGPMANVLMAIFWLLLFRIASTSSGGELGVENTNSQWLIEVGQAGFIINVLLAVFNLLPIPPLDGGRILMTLLPVNVARQIAPLENYGMLILVALMLSGVLSKILLPLMSAMQTVLLALVF